MKYKQGVGDGGWGNCRLGEYLSSSSTRTGTKFLRFNFWPSYVPTKDNMRQPRAKSKMIATLRIFDTMSNQHRFSSAHKKYHQCILSWNSRILQLLELVFWLLPKGNLSKNLGIISIRHYQKSRSAMVLTVINGSADIQPKKKTKQF